LYSQKESILRIISQKIEEFNILVDPEERITTSSLKDKNSSFWKEEGQDILIQNLIDQFKKLHYRNRLEEELALLNQEIESNQKYCNVDNEDDDDYFNIF
jgi:hypothetical protein